MLIGEGNKTTTILRGIGVKGGGLCINHCHPRGRIKGNVGGCYCIIALGALVVALVGPATAVVPPIVPHTSNQTASMGRGGEPGGVRRQEIGVLLFLPPLLLPSLLLLEPLP